MWIRPVDRPQAPERKIRHLDSVLRALPVVLIRQGHDAVPGDEKKNIGPPLFALFPKLRGRLEEEFRGGSEFGVTFKEI